MVGLCRLPWSSCQAAAHVFTGSSIMSCTESGHCISESSSGKRSSTGLLAVICKVQDSTEPIQSTPRHQIGRYCSTVDLNLKAIGSS